MNRSIAHVLESVSLETEGHVLSNISYIGLRAHHFMYLIILYDVAAYTKCHLHEETRQQHRTKLSREIFTHISQDKFMYTVLSRVTVK